MVSLRANYVWHIWWLILMAPQHWWIRDEQVTQSTWTCGKDLTLSCMPPLLLNWTGMGLTNGPPSEWLDGLTGWWHPKSCHQWLDVQVGTSDRKCSSGADIGTDVVQHLCQQCRQCNWGNSASLPLPSTCVLQLTHWREVMPEGPWQAWEVDLCEHHKSQQCQVWVKAIPNANIGWVKNELTSALGRTGERLFTRVNINKTKGNSNGKGEGLD